MELNNPKALNIEKLYSEKNKITLGFKCPPSLKLKLAEQAQKLKISLSEYVESIVASHDESRNLIFAKKIKQIEFYENEILQTLFYVHKDQTIDFVNGSGKQMSINIKTIQDVYTVIINSFKIEKQ